MDISIRDKIYEMQKYLDSIVQPYNLHSKEILEISKKLDVLIFESITSDTEIGVKI